MGFFIALAMTTTLAVQGRANATPSIASAGDFVAVAWGASVPSGATGVFVSVSCDGARTFGVPVRVNRINGFTARLRLPAEGTPHHPRLVVAADGSLAAAWDEVVSGSRHVVLARAASAASAKPQFHREVLPNQAPGLYPVLTAVRGAVVAAWTSGAVSTDSTIQVARVGGPNRETRGVRVVQEER